MSRSTQVPALTDKSLKISSSSFKECGLVQAVPECVAEEAQHIQISSSSFKNQHVDLEGKAGFLTFDSEQGVLEIKSSSFHSFSSSSSSGVIVFKKGSKLQLKWASFSEVDSFGNSSSCVSIETIPETLDLNNTWF
ncbi:hypothetical protein BLNAU_10741 [Blattamonas nauphoetae]|uniref:Uncharacterized protein n=1 Tax=Blattamonas nauphoetae TaxID=2049346 RepID=A0ABQ9XRN7_9EUKA|nr:hypothetical protein BLNAU_10741 [Blattamonas nauphoetae]